VRLKRLLFLTKIIDIVLDFLDLFENVTEVGFLRHSVHRLLRRFGGFCSRKD